MSDVTIEDVKNEIKSASDAGIETVKAETRAALQEIVQARNASIVNTPENSVEKELRKISDDLIHTRAVTLNSTSIGVVSDIVTKLTNSTGGLLDLIDMDTSDVQLGTVPVFTPLAEMVYVGEGATGVAPDGTSGLASVQLNLQPYDAVLAVSNGVDMFSALGNKLPDAFANTQRRTIVKNILQGTGTSSFVGLNTNASITQINAATGSVANGLKWSDLVNLIAQFQGVFEFDDVSKLAIVIHPTILGKIKANSTNSALDISYFNNFGINKTIDGVRVIPSPYAPSTVTTGLAGAIIGYWPHYSVRTSKVFKLNAIPISRTDNIEYNGIAYMDGKPVSNTSFARLNFLT